MALAWSSAWAGETTVAFGSRSRHLEQHSDRPRSVRSIRPCRRSRAGGALALVRQSGLSGVPTPGGAAYSGGEVRE